MAGILDSLLGRVIDRRIAAWQGDLIRRQCDEVQNMYRQMRGWRHDSHNHIQALLALSMEIRRAEDPIAELDRLDEYLGELNEDLTRVDTVVKTGNVMVDAILNSKLSLIRVKEIDLNVKASVPASLAVSEVDLCVILGNLLDNALEACLRAGEAARPDQWIRVYIGVFKRQLYLSVSNATGRDVVKEPGGYRSAKRSESHGFGLMRIDRIVEKYHGYVNRQHEEGVFATEILLPL